MDDGTQQVSVLQARRVLARHMAKHRVNRRLVEDDVALEPIAQPVDQGGGIVGEAQGGVAVRPATLVLQTLRQVPVEQGGVGRHTLGQQGIDHAGIVVQPRWIDRPLPAGQDPRPADREPIGVQPRCCDQIDIFGVAAIAVGGDTGVGAVDHLAGQLLEPVPNAGPASIGGLSALGLESGRGHAPHEVLGKLSGLGMKLGVWLGLTS